MALRGYVGTTDYNWYKFLFQKQEEARAKGKAGLDEVNFWQPNSTRV